MSADLVTLIKAGWDLSMAFIVSFVWFAMIFMIITISMISDTCAIYLSYILLFLCGPILLIVNIVGCIFNCIEMKSFCVN